MTRTESSAKPERPPGREVLGARKFRFLCDADVDCFNRCCHDPDLELYPYDVIRLSRRLGLSSGAFLEKHTAARNRTNPYFPSVMLRMAQAGRKDVLSRTAQFRSAARPCPFLGRDGCGVYEDRPDACRMFPLERGVTVRPFEVSTRREIYFLQRVPFCHGHGRDGTWTSESWVASQGLEPYNRMADLWAEMNLLFRRNPWGPAGVQNPMFRMAYTACYDLDRFREFVVGSSFLKRFSVEPDGLERIRRENEALLELGFDWLKYTLFQGKPNLFTPTAG